MKSLLNICFFFFIFSFPNDARSENLVLKNHGKPIKTLSINQLKELAGAKPVTVFEPHESVKREYGGFSMNSILTAVYGESWKDAEEILFTCSDGYQPSIPSVKFNEYSAYLVYAGSGGEGFSLINKLQNNEHVELGPFYLVWDNLKHPELRAEGGSDWPYQVTTIDLISFSDRFPKMAPPKDSSDGVKNGFIAFRKYCMTCHTINGEGGGKSVELNYPVNVTEYMEESRLIRWIDNPSSIKRNTTMPALNPNAVNRDKLINDIVAYLKERKDNKQKSAKCVSD